MSTREDLNVAMLAAVEILHRSGCSPPQAALALICTLAAVLAEGEQPPPEMEGRISHIFWQLRMAKMEGGLAQLKDEPRGGTELN